MPIGRPSRNANADAFLKLYGLLNNEDRAAVVGGIMKSLVRVATEEIPTAARAKRPRTNGEDRKEVLTQATT